MSETPKENRNNKPGPTGSACSDLLCGFPSPPESIRTQLAEGMLREKEHLIKAAIQNQIGFAWKISDLKGRGEFIINPEKVETFVFDGVALIEFYPPEFFLDMNTIGGKLNYRLLYT